MAMATWTADPSFYPSPRMAMKAAPETLAYVATFDPDRKTPSLAVVDVDPNSATYSTIVGTTPMPKTGDELHHFGWNACSSCLCPNAPHPHVERRYLVVPGLRSSRIHILDTKPDAKNPKIVRVIEPEEVAERAGYTRPHTVHLRTGRHLCGGPRQPRRQRAGWHFPDGPRDLRRAGPVGDGPRSAATRLRCLVAPRSRHARHQRVGHARHV